MDANRTIKAREMDFLLRELTIWQEDALITQDQAKQITELYTVQKRSLVRMLLAAGFVLVTLGGISLIAANWADIPRVIRLGMILTGYVLCMIAAWGCEVKYPAASRAFLLFAAFIYGAGIFLVARMYNYEAHWSTGVGWWIVGLFPAVFLLRDTFQLLLIQLLSLSYLFGQDIVSDFFAGGTEPLSALFPPIHVTVLAIALWLAWLMTQGYTSLVANLLLTLWILASRLTLCFSVATAFLTLSAIGLALSLLPSLLPSPATPSPIIQMFQDLQTIGLLLMGLCGLPLTLSEVWEGSLLAASLPPYVLSVIATIVLGGLLLWRFHRGRSIAGAFFVLLLCRWFFDDLLSFMSRAVGFTSIGVLLLAFGIALEWYRRKKKS